MVTAAIELAEQNVFQRIRKRIHDLNRENDRLLQDIEEEESRADAIKCEKEEAAKQYLQDAENLRRRQLIKIEQEM